MMGRLLILSLLLLIILPASSYAASGDDTPLTLLDRPGTNNQTGQNPGIPNQTEELRDIRGPIPIAEPLPYLLIIGTIVLVLLVAAAIIWFLKKRNIPTPTPPLPPWERALRDLTDAKKLLNPERGLLYMDRASQILRRYIESRFAIQSTRQTTREFLHGLTNIGGRSPLQTFKTELQVCLEQADMAKFAHRLPKLENLEQMEIAVTTFIKRTEPDEPSKPSTQTKKTKQVKLAKRLGRSIGSEGGR